LKKAKKELALYIVEINKVKKAKKGVNMKNKISVFSIVLFLSVFIMLISCGEQKPKWKGTIEKENGITVIKNPREPMYEEDVLSLEEELTIGKTIKGEKSAFVVISGIEVDSKEHIYVLDGRASSVIVFDKEGNHIRNFGREGQGPGEFQRPIDIVVTPDETIMILDRRNNRLSFFSKKGELLKEISTSKIPSLFRIYPDLDGNYTARINLRGQKYIYQIKKLDANLEELSLIAELEYPRRTDVLEMFSPNLIAVVMKDDKIVLGNWQQYELTIADRTGRKIREITKDHDPVKITDEDKERLIKELSAGILLKRRVEFPDNYPAFQGLSCDEQGRIFVRTSERAEDKGGYYYDVFDKEGKYISKIFLKVRPQVWKKNKLYTIEEDEEGFQMVKRYKVTWKY